MIDTHAHLDHIEDIEGAMQRATEAGITDVIAPGMDLSSCKKLMSIRDQFQSPRVHFGFGMHPSESKDEDVSQIVELARKHRDELVAIGEIGLDFWYKWVRKDQEKKDQQRRIFRTFLELAKELDLPAIVHSRGCWRECLETVQDIGLRKVEFHWYSGPVDVLKDILAEGYYVSTSPSVGYSPQSREAMLEAPIEQTLIETDSPVFYKNRKDENDEGFQAEPKDVLKTLKAYSQLKGIPEAEASEILIQNAKDFFNFKKG